MGNEEPERPDWTLGPADAAKLSLCPFSAVEGEAIIRQGDVGSTFFLITAGTVGIRRQVGGSIHELGTLGPGSIVGELAVLRRAPRNATVVALEPVVGFTGDLGAMERLVGHDAAFPERLATVAASRLAEAAEPVEVTLRDGSRVSVRPLLRKDRQRAAEAMSHYSEESRYERFHSAAEASSELLDLLCDVDYANHFVWVAFEGPEESYVGSARFVRLHSDPSVAEMAVGVADLVGALVVAALEMGITHFSAEVLTDNRPMRAILDRLGAEWIEEGFGEASASVLLAAPVALLGASEIRRFRQLVATIVSPTAVFAA
jgi:CRP-like cAMP-binding protein